MKRKELHEGGFYAGPSGQVRHVYRLDGDLASFEVVRRGVTSPNHTATPQLGERRDIKATSIAAWAFKEVEDPGTH
jgi:hypothetical protein